MGRLGGSAAPEMSPAAVRRRRRVKNSVGHHMTGGRFVMRVGRSFRSGVL